MKLRLSAFLALALLALTALRAAPVTRDLGAGLAYSRVHLLPADLPLPPDQPAPLVLDLRYAATDRAGIDAFDAWLKFRARPGTPVFVLANAETARGLRQVLAAHRNNPSLIVIGPAGDGFSPDISIAVGHDAERRAYDALEAGASIAALTVENAGKPRRDEASIAHEHANPSASDAGDPEADDPNMVDDTDTTAAPAPAAKPAPPALPIDRALQRAVQLHRALAALKRI